MTKPLPQLVYECDSCGQCCKKLILEVDHLDALREPRIARDAHLMDGHGKLPLEDAVWSMNSRGGDHACVFLGTDCRCSIYATRPNVCVSFQAGGEKCQDLRRMAGIEPLKPRPARDILDRIPAPKPAPSASACLPQHDAANILPAANPDRLAADSMTTFITFRVDGEPKAQPRPRAFVRNGHARVYDAGTAEGWKSAIAAAALPHRPTAPLDGPLTLAVVFLMPRPKSHYRPGRWARSDGYDGETKTGAPVHHTQKPDLDNMVKAVKDALTQIGMWRDDCLVVEETVSKIWAERGGAEIRIGWKTEVIEPGGGK